MEWKNDHSVTKRQKQFIMKFFTHCTAKCFANTDTEITKQEFTSKFITTRPETVPICCIFKTCAIHMYRGNGQWIFFNHNQDLHQS